MSTPPVSAGDDPAAEPEKPLSPVEAAESEGVRESTGVCAERVEALAQSLWRSVGEHAEMSLQSWLMAEVMIRELTYASGVFGIALHQTIRERAYQLWEEAGCQPGRAVEYWLTAEREVWDGLAPPVGQARPPKLPRIVGTW